MWDLMSHLVSDLPVISATRGERLVVVRFSSIAELPDCKSGCKSERGGDTGWRPIGRAEWGSVSNIVDEGPAFSVLCSVLHLVGEEPACFLWV